jgi:tripartite-type tricarboxylate transporter receptor subunit TctC
MITKRFGLLACLRVAFAFLGVALVGVSPTSAQVYPSRPITMVVPYGAGGPTDAVGRIMAEGMKAALGQPVIIDNIAGASGTIGSGRVARATADGYTIVIGNVATHALNGALFKLQYDLVTDFAPVLLVSSDPLVIVARKSLSEKNLRDFIAWLKANPEMATQGTTGAGGISTVAGLLLQRATGARFRFVPYRGGLGQAMLDLVAGQIDFMIDAATNSLPQINAGTIKAYAVTSKSRLSIAPDIPTVDEAGLPGFYALNWQALFAPRDTPKEVIAKLNSAGATALADPDVRRRLADIGQAVFPAEQRTPEALAAFQGAEIEKWWPIIKASF